MSSVVSRLRMSEEADRRSTERPRAGWKGPLVLLVPLLLLFTTPLCPAEETELKRGDKAKQGTSSATAGRGTGERSPIVFPDGTKIGYTYKGGGDAPGDSTKGDVFHHPHADVHINLKVVDQGVIDTEYSSSASGSTKRALSGENAYTAHYVVSGSDADYAEITVVNAIWLESKVSRIDKDGHVHAELTAIDILEKMHLFTHALRGSRSSMQRHTEKIGPLTRHDCTCAAVQLNAELAESPTLARFSTLREAQTAALIGTDAGGQAYSTPVDTEIRIVGKRRHSGLEEKSTHISSGRYVFDTVQGNSYGPVLVESTIILRASAKCFGYATDRCEVDAYSDLMNDVWGKFFIVKPGQPPATPPPSGPPNLPSPLGPITPTPSGSTSDEGKYLAMVEDDDVVSDQRAVLAAADGVHVVVSQSSGIGLFGQAGLRRPSVCLAFSAELQHDLEFEFGAVPGASATVPPTATASTGDRFLTIPFDVHVAGDLSVTATLVGVNGVPVTPVPVTVQATHLAISEVVSPDLDVSNLGVSEGEPWGVIGPIRVERSAFCDANTQASAVAVTTDDPCGILQFVPSTVTIPAGEYAVEFTVDRTGQSGSAELHFQLGEEEATVHVESTVQSWSASAQSIRLPVGGRAFVAAQLALAPEEDRQVQVTGLGANLEQSGSGFVIEERSRIGFLELTAAVTGTGTMSLDTVGLATVDVPFEVVDAEVQLTPSSLALHNVAGSEEGEIALAVPDGVTFENIAIPTDVQVHLDVSGEGTNLLRVAFTGVSPRPASISIELTLAGEFPSTDSSVTVADELHEDQQVYTVEVLEEGE